MISQLFGRSERTQEVEAQISTRFTALRTSEIADVNPKDRIVYDGRTYSITGVREVKHKRWLEIDAAAARGMKIKFKIEGAGGGQTSSP